MTCLIPTRLRTHLLLSGTAAALAVFALTVAPSPAQAGVWVSAGGPCCGYLGPGPYSGYPPPYAYYPPPAPGYYPPPAPGYYPPPAPTASAYPAAPAAPEAAPTAAQGAPPITYTNKPPFTNSAGQTCREYKANDSGRDVFGTACRQTDGQWRVVN